MASNSQGWPKLPKAVWTARGPMPVRVVKRLAVEGDEDGKEFRAWGAFGTGSRVIELEADASPATQWATLFHEIVEAALWDTGVHNLMPAEPLKEAVCDAIGGYLAGMVKYGGLTLKGPAA